MLTLSIEEVREEGYRMRIDKRLFILGLLLLIVTMVLATQYAVTKITYEYAIVHPSLGKIRFIGSDNSSDGIRVLRMTGGNNSNGSVTLVLGNWSTNTNKTYSAAFVIVNEEHFPVNITNITVSTTNYSYMKIWLHGNGSADARSNLTDPSTLLMYNNGTHINTTNTTNWVLAPGDGNTSNLCYNVSDRPQYSIPTPWDNISHVRYIITNKHAVSNLSDFVWVQIALDIPARVDLEGTHSGAIIIYFKATTH